jgi:hypothetical protein
MIITQSTSCDWYCQVIAWFILGLFIVILLSVASCSAYGCTNRQTTNSAISFHRYIKYRMYLSNDDNETTTVIHFI